MRRALWILAVICATASPTFAQSADRAMPTFGDEVRAFGHDFGALWSRDNGIWTAAGAAAVLGARPFDDTATRWFGDMDQRALRKIFIPGKFIGRDVVQVGIAGATYLVGRLGDRPNATAAGYEMLRADLITEGIVQALKFTVRRRRPDGSNRLSFPSGHAAMTFATATVLERRFGWLQSVPAFLGASYVSAARVTEDKHFVSDVIAGAVVGVIAARTVTRDANRGGATSASTASPAASRAPAQILFVVSFQ
jgi:membrane-associated phospholipid phosphatase